MAAGDLPVYEQRAQESARPNFRHSGTDPRHAALAQLGQGIERAGHGAADLAGHIVEQQETAALQEAYAELTNTRQSLLMDPSNGLVTRKGHAALKERESVRTMYEAKSKQLVGNIKSPRVRARFEKLAQQDRMSFMQSLDRHVARESDMVAAQALEGATKAALNDAVGATQRGELGEVSTAIGNGLGAIDQRARSMGWDDEYAESKRREFATQAHVGVLDTMIRQGDAAGARTYLAMTRKEMDAPLLARSGIEKRVDALGARDTARRLADAVWDEAEGDPARAADLLREYADHPEVEGYGALKDTAVFDETMQRVTQRGSQETALRRQADSPRLGRLEQALRTGGTVSEASDDYVQLSDEGKATYHRMRDAELRSRRTARNEERRIQDEVDRNILAYYGGLDLVGDEGRDQASIDIDNDDVLKDGTARVKDVIRARQKNLLRQRAKDDGVSLRTFDAQIKADVEAQGFNKKTTGADYTAVMRRKYQEYADDPKNQDRPQPPDDLVRQWRRDALLYGERGPSEGYLQPNMRGFEAELKGVEFSTDGFKEKNRKLIESLGPFPDTPGGGRAPGAAAPSAPPAPATPAKPAPKAKAMPPDLRQLAIDAYKRKHGTGPTESQLQEMYDAYQRKQ